MSAHCIPVNSKWLEDHLKDINKNKAIAACFGKQIPMPGSSVQNLIDLDIIFKDQPVLYQKDPYLNNANAFYRASVLKNLFNSKLTNIEDRIWAKNIVKKVIVFFIQQTHLFFIYMEFINMRVNQIGQKILIKF